MKKFAALHQEIQVNFRYGVYFTQDVFARHNPLLSEIVAGGGGDLPRKILVVVDRGLYRHHPDLLGKITDYHKLSSGPGATRQAPVAGAGGRAGQE